MRLLVLSCIVGITALPIRLLADDGPTRTEVAGALVVCGGGSLPQSVKARFLELGGGSNAKLVVIPTASSYADRPDAENYYLEQWTKLGVQNPRLLHTRSRDIASKPEFAQPIREATCVWISGGEQGKVADAYLGTPVEEEIYKLVDRGGAVGGTSAGAAIQSRVMIREGNPVAVVDKGLDLVPFAVVDQHFLRRNRINRLLGVLATRPGLTGIGIDEGTAIVVRGKNCEVIGDSFVVFCRHGKDARSPQVEILRPGQSIDLTLTKRPAAPQED